MDGFTLVELLAVMIVMPVLLAVAAGFQVGARTRAGDAAAKSNIRVAQPAIEAYYADNGTYSGMSVASLTSTYSPGVQGIEVVTSDTSSYCVRSTVEGRTWYARGSGGAITQTACA